MKTFCLQTLGCKVNQYEGGQVAALLRAYGLVETTPDRAELRIINSCSVTVQAASQSRQQTRRMTRLPILSDGPSAPVLFDRHPSAEPLGNPASRPRVVVMGCWATSDQSAAASLPGVDAVLTHRDDLAAQLEQLLADWGLPRDPGRAIEKTSHACAFERPPEATNEVGWMMKAGSGAGGSTNGNRANCSGFVNENSSPQYARRLRGANTLPIFGQAQPGRRRAFLKVQDGCDAHCTYCIIPQLRSTLHSKPIETAVDEARRLVDAGHVEIVLTGIFLGAYGQPTALRRRQGHGPSPLARLVESLCKRVAGLKRLRLSSIEPGDLSGQLLAMLASHEQIVPHFHLPLQSGCDAILRRMNRQYRRDEFLQMVDRVNAAFDRPALTTDIIVGFPGEGDAEFGQTVEAVRRCGFIHVHAFAYSPRPGTAAARWRDQFVHGPVVNERISALGLLAEQQSYAFRSKFSGETAEVIVERGEEGDGPRTFRHGRCERYFPIHFETPDARPGDLVRLRIERVTQVRTFGSGA